MQVFGSHITVKKPRVQKYKLDTTHVMTGIFLGFTASDQTIWFEDTTTGEIKSARHAVFDVVHFSTNHLPPSAKQLMDISEEHLMSPPATLTPPSTILAAVIPV